MADTPSSPPVAMCFCKHRREQICQNSHCCQKVLAYQSVCMGMRLNVGHTLLQLDPKSSYIQDWSLGVKCGYIDDFR